MQAHSRLAYLKSSSLHRDCVCEIRQNCVSSYNFGESVSRCSLSKTFYLHLRDYLCKIGLLLTFFLVQWKISQVLSSHSCQLTTVLQFQLGCSLKPWRWRLLHCSLLFCSETNTMDKKGSLHTCYCNYKFFHSLQFYTQDFVDGKSGAWGQTSLLPIVDNWSSN